MLSQATQRPADGKLAVLMPGLGAVATTFIAGVHAIQRGETAPIGSLALTGRMPGSETLIHDATSLASLDDLVFGGWDIYEGSCYDAAKRANVLRESDLERAREELSKITPMAAVFEQEYVRNISGPNVKSAPTKAELAEQLVADIRGFMADNGCDRAVGVWCASTERFVVPSEVHLSIEAFEKGLREDHPAISPSMIYTYAFIKAGVPLANGAPNLACDVPALVMAKREGVALAGKDFKTGQTLMKTLQIGRASCRERV